MGAGAVGAGAAGEGAWGADVAGAAGACGVAAAAAPAGLPEAGAGLAAGPGVGLDVVLAAGLGAAAGLLGEPPALPASSAGNDSRMRRTTGASMVEDAARTNSPWFFRCSSRTLLSTPSSLASS